MGDRDERVLRELSGKYDRRECVLLGAGPSLKALSDAQLRRICRGRVVIAIKQAFFRVADICDYHVINFGNNYIYEYPHPGTVVLGCEGDGRKAVLGRIDIHFRLEFTQRLCADPLPAGWAGLLARSVAWNRNFDDYLLERHHDRPFGPGIFYEMGMYLLVHLGIARCFAVGWDIGKPVVRAPWFANPLPLWDCPPSLHRLLHLQFNTFRLTPRNLGNVLCYFLGRHYNRPRPRYAGGIPGERQLTAERSHDAYCWLQSRNVELILLSDQSLADGRIPRMRAGDVESLDG